MVSGTAFPSWECPERGSLWHPSIPSLQHWHLELPHHRSFSWRTGLGAKDRIRGTQGTAFQTPLSFYSPHALKEGGEGAIGEAVAASATCAAQHLRHILGWNIDLEARLRKRAIFVFTHNADFHVQSNCLTSSEQKALSGAPSFWLLFDTKSVICLKSGSRIKL